MIKVGEQPAWRLVRSVCWVFGAVILLDSVATYFMCTRGIAIEANPLPGLLHLDLSTFLIVKVMWGILGLGILWYLIPRQRRWVQWFITIAFLSYVVWYAIGSTITYIYSLG